VLNGPTEEIVVRSPTAGAAWASTCRSRPSRRQHGFAAIEIDGTIFGELERVGRTTRDGVLISDEMVVSLAAVRALAEFEFLNATYRDGELTVHRTVNLGLTRHVEEDGMLVPVVHAAAGLTLRALARRVGGLDERLQSRQLTTDDLMGGTFTLVGAPSARTLFTEPIIIQPEVAALSVGSGAVACPSW